MGSYDGAEVCEFVGLWSSFIKLIWVFYRVDKLVILRNKNGKETFKIGKDIVKLFKSVGFNIEIATSLKSSDFLDVTFDIQTNTYYSYKNLNVLYIKSQRFVHPKLLISSQMPQ